MGGDFDIPCNVPRCGDHQDTPSPCPFLLRSYREQDGKQNGNIDVLCMPNVNVKHG